MLVQIPLLIVASALLIPCAMLLIECLSAFLSPLPARPSPSALSEDFSIAVLMPAHNEADVIVETLTALTPQLSPQDRLIVVADNCTDQTAQLARKCGAIVLERTDDTQLGKGYALDCGLRFMAATPPAAVVMVDADCQFRKGSVRQLASDAIARQRPVQGVYLIDSGDRPGNSRSGSPAASRSSNRSASRSAEPSLKEAVSAFAFKLKNLVRPLGLAQMGLPCLLTGTGMAFPWSVMATVNLASNSIVEDMKLGFDLAIAGTPPVLCSSVTVVGPLPPSDDAAKTQRTRWEHGHLQLILHYFPRLLSKALAQGRLDLLAIALDLIIPPLSLLVMIGLTLSVLMTLAAALSGAWLPAFICYGAGGALMMAIILAWTKFAQNDLSLQTLLQVPVYILWKIPLYLKFVREPQVEWVRTSRQVQRDK
jgi:cellulose synthase/poly-beta-1,6-N-acetylglucosamine synthase-like glycosyltransferase